MAKKTEENIETVEQDFNFPTAVIDGVEGITIKASSKEEAQKKLKEILNKSKSETD